MHTSCRSITLCAAVVFLQPALSRAAPVFSTFISFDVPGGVGTVSAGINDSDVVTGFYTNPSTGATVGFERRADGTFINPIVEPKDNAGFTRGLGINDAGTVVGDFLHNTSTTSLFHGYLLNGSTFKQFNIAGVPTTGLYGVNNRGDLVGTLSTTSGDQLGFIDVGNVGGTGGTVTEFSPPGASSTFGSGLNDLDQAVGVFTDASNVTHGYLRDADGTFTQLDFPGAVDTGANGINDTGEIVGNYFTDSAGDGAGFIYESGAYYSFSFPGAVGYTDILGVNNAGDITGTYVDANGVQHGFIAIAAPVPDSMVLLAAAGLTLACRRLALAIPRKN
jgi:hypothetical protein